MEPKLYKIFTFIVCNLNWSTSFIQYARFKRERLKLIENGADQNQLELESDQEFGAERASPSNGSRKDQGEWGKNTHKKSGFIADVIWMLEYNQNGLMQLIMYSFHLILLTLQVVISLLYVSFPTARDPDTNEFKNSWLRYAELMACTDIVHKFDPESRYNKLLGLVACQCLILRLKSFYSRLKTAKINRSQYRDINIVELEIAYAEEIRFSQLNTLKQAIKLSGHKCNLKALLRGNLRRKVFEFNHRVRSLSKIDRIYYYNQINFDKCFEEVPLFADYFKQVQIIDKELFNEDKNSVRIQNSGNEISWLQYLFSINLPNKISYVPTPEHRLDIKAGAAIYYMFLLSILTTVTLMSTTCMTISYLALENLNSDKEPLSGFIYSLTRTNITIMLITFNVYDSGLLAACSVLFISRSLRIIRLLEIETKIYRSHLRKLSIIEVTDQLLSHFKTEVLNLPKFSTGFRRRFGNYTKLFYQNEKIPASESYSEFSFMRERHSIQANFTNSDDDDDDDDDNVDVGSSQIDELIFLYKKDLKVSNIELFNENICYLLDLVEVLQIELIDHKRFFTLLLDVNIIFGTLGCSVSLGVLIETTDSLGIYFATLGGAAYLLPMILSLSIGASSEAALTGIYRRLRPLMADELGFLDNKNKRRLFKICDNLVLSHNRSFVILGNFPLSFGSLASILVWVITCTFVIQRFL